MIIHIEDWIFDIDMSATMEDSARKAADHCTCGYCRNFYQSLDVVYPHLEPFLAQFGIDPEGVTELLPFEPTLYLVGYDVFGRILHSGRAPLYVDGIPIAPEEKEDFSFRLTVGELELPWVLEEDMDEVISPANEPEFLERMDTIWLLRHGGSDYLS